MADKNSQNKNLNKDSGLDIDLTDLDDISLEEMDDFEGIDFENLDLDDIDFDDLDVTSLDTGISYQKEPLDTEDFDFDALLAEDKAKPESEQKGEKKAEEKKKETKSSGDSQEKAVKPEKTDSQPSTKPAGNEDVFSDAEKTMNEDMSEPTQEDIDAFLAALNEEPAGNESRDSEDYSGAGSDLDDLFKQSMEISFENGELDDIEDRSGAADGKKAKNGKTKKSISEILFGEPDEDDAEEERLLAERKAQKEIKKTENAAKKSEKKALKDAKKQEALAVKEKAGKAKAKAKASEKARKAAAREAEYQAELEEEGNQKPVSTAAVVIVFAAFAILAGFVILGTKHFDYSRVVSKATEYFERQRYRLAYDEIAGVDVKAKDEELKDRIYTVMYVERLYESYENNMTLGRRDKALDALIRGLQKYDEHYEEAVELEISEDIDVCKQQILTALSETFSMTEEEAYAIMEMDGQDYIVALANYAEAAR